MLKEISSCSAGSDGVTRLPFTEEHKRALKIITKWMVDSGLSTRIDDAGTLIGKYNGPKNAPTFLVGSHQDSVINGGMFDGIMGVLLPLIAIRNLNNLPYNIEFLAFADEEGIRFPTSLLGSRALAGTLSPTVLNLKDNQGLSIRDAIKNLNLVPENIFNLKREKQKYLGFLEVHIEQGPILYNKNLPLGTVSSISGIERHDLSIYGLSSHAGTMPMIYRKDALCAASEIILMSEKLASNCSNAVATVGMLNIQPNVANVIPEKANLILEVRSGSDVERENLSSNIIKNVNDIINRRKLEVTINKTYEQSATKCDNDLQLMLSDSLYDAAGYKFHLDSGATHDASAISDLCPISMLFVRCKNGISHNPEEEASEEDMALAVKVIENFFKRLSTII